MRTKIVSGPGTLDTGFFAEITYHGDCAVVAVYDRATRKVVSEYETATKGAAASARKEIQKMGVK